MGTVSTWPKIQISKTTDNIYLPIYIYIYIFNYRLTVSCSIEQVWSDPPNGRARATKCLPKSESYIRCWFVQAFSWGLSHSVVVCVWRKTNVPVVLGTCPCWMLSFVDQCWGLMGQWAHRVIGWAGGWAPPLEVGGQLPRRENPCSDIWLGIVPPRAYFFLFSEGSKAPQAAATQRQRAVRPWNRQKRQFPKQSTFRKSRINMVE